MKKIFFLILTTISIYAKAQNIHKLIIENKPCPDYLFTDVKFYPQKRVSISDFKGQWLIIDCWNRWCPGCIAEMQHIDSLKKVFRSKVQFMLVGYTGTQYRKKLPPDDKGIRDLYDNLRLKENLTIPIAYDSTFFHRSDIAGCPYLIIVDPKGIVRGVTFALSIQNINDFLDEKTPVLPKAYSWHDPTAPDFKHLSKEEQQKGFSIYNNQK